MSQQQNEQHSDNAHATEIKPQPSRPVARPLPPWKVILHNDDVNAFDYVAQTITTLTPLTQADAWSRTFRAHQFGHALLLTTHGERAELYQRQFGSCNLTVTIEPAD